jgi:tetratricopeptide (TPR) repeat protein
VIILTVIQTYKKYFEGYIALALISLCTFSNTHAGNKIIFAYITQETDITFQHTDADIGRQNTDETMSMTKKSHSASRQDIIKPAPTSPKATPKSSELDAKSIQSTPKQESETPGTLFITPLTIDALREEAINAAVQLTKDFPNNADAVFRLGNVYRNQGNSTMAVKCFEDCLKLNSNHAGAYYDMAWISFQKAEYKKSIDLWQRVLEIDPKLQGVYRFLASALICLGKTEEAISALEKEIEISGGTADSYSLLGNQYLLLKEYKKAKSCFEMVIKIQPAYTSAYYGLAITCERLGQKDKFKEYIETFRKLKDKEMKALKDRDKAYDDLVLLRQSVAQTHTSIGKYYYTRGNVQKAEELLRRAAVLDPRHTGCRILLASLYQQDGRAARALPLHEQLSRIEPNNAIHHMNVGILSSQLQRIDNAEKAFERAIKCAPKQSIGYRELARLYLKSNRNLPDAKRLMEQAVKLEVTGENYSILGWAYYMSGETANAISAAKRAVELEPDNMNYRQIYEDIKKEN